MKYIPILFSTPMVQAILAGRKTQTRRVMIPQPTDDDIKRIKDWGSQIFPEQKYKPDDILWVRETLRQHGELGLQYLTDNEWLNEEIIPNTYPSYRNYAHCNIPAIHMPKWACRLFLQVKSIRVERLQDISEEDSIAEGVEKYPGKENEWIDYEAPYEFFCINAKESFQTLWESINGEQSWKDNPWVWVIEFERIEKPLNWPL